jgi:hypothetical protein
LYWVKVAARRKTVVSVGLTRLLAGSVAGLVSESSEEMVVAVVDWRLISEASVSVPVLIAQRSTPQLPVVAFFWTTTDSCSSASGSELCRGPALPAVTARTTATTAVTATAARYFHHLRRMSASQTNRNGADVDGSVADGGGHALYGGAGNESDGPSVDAHRLARQRLGGGLSKNRGRLCTSCET